MKTSLDCFPCFMKQALYTVSLATGDLSLQEKIMQKSATMLADFDLRISPPENAEDFYLTLAELAGCPDPFHALKKESTSFAMGLRPTLAHQLENHADPFLAAVKYAMAGNIIDYGAHHDFDPHKAINLCLNIEPVINDYALLKKAVRSAQTILFLADNCGELVFDGLLIERFPAGKKVSVAVKERPVINDATCEDALQSGLPDNCTVISNGTACPGTPVEKCSQDFQQLFQSADLIISKGQGNFETLSEATAPIYFLLSVKCDVVAQHITKKANRNGIKVAVGDMVLLKN